MLRQPAVWLTACFLVAASAASVHAQRDAFSEGFAGSDLQFFSPVDFDFENQPLRKENGWFFGYDKLSWAITGERQTIGSTSQSFGSTNPNRLFQTGGLGVGDPGGPTEGAIVTIPIPATVSGITSGPPRAEFAWGERYEFGHLGAESGWMIGILDGPEAVSAESYGFGLANNPLGSVLVVFDSAAGNRDLFRGFLDFEDSAGNIVVGGDGTHDDLDDDGKHGGQSIIDLVAPGNIPETDVDDAPDFDDLAELPTAFDTMTVRNTTEMQGIEMMYIYNADNTHRMIKDQNKRLEIAYGVRYLRLRDQFRVDGTGGTLGVSFWDTRITNNLVGPQLAMKWMRQRGRMRLDISGRTMFGYNVGNLEQDAAIGASLVPGQANRFLNIGPTVSNSGRQEQDYSPLVEIRAQTSYQLTGAIAFKLGYNALFIDNIYRAANHVRYRLPDLGLRTDAGTQEIFINGVNFGFDVVY